MDLDFKKNYTLENERVLLRPLEISDKEILMPYAVNEPELWKFNLNGGNGRENFDRYFAAAIKQREEGKEYPFIVFDKRANAYAGSTRFYNISQEFQRLEIGYTWYGKQFQGTGINKNCKHLLLAFAFDQLGMIRVGFGANNKNERSINAMKSIGCTVEGVLRRNGRDAEGSVTDSILLSILKEEWDEKIKVKLASAIANFK